MLLKPLTLAAAGLAAATQAFLLPPDISQSDVDTVSSLPHVEALSIPEHINLNLSCPGCLLQTKGRHHGVGAETSPARRSHLELAFSIDHSESPDRLLVNGYPLFPKANPFLDSLKAAVVPDNCVRTAIKELRGHRRRPQPQQELGYQLSVGQRATNPEDGLALYALDLQIIEVGDAFVDGIPNVHITLVKDIATGALAIGSVETTESTTAIATPMDKQAECSTFMCKWLAIMKDNMAKMKGKPCHGKMRGGAKGPRPHHEHHHHHKGRPNKMEGDARHHSWGQLFKNIAHHILLPVAVGIVAGVSVSLIGMMVGTLIVSVWRLFFRRPSHRRRSHSRSHSHSHHKAPKTEVAAAEAEEKSGLIEHQDPPPSYDEEAVPTPPSYEEEVTPKTNV
ncbi:hypothetical protein BR93DRAFT_565640 [Coniochaeta sp. PMI_546]|nr:hypothetical protein BR93DRAFT_565640 [Coniochaeta sp. PMI_546]